MDFLAFNEKIPLLKITKFVEGNQRLVSKPNHGSQRTTSVESFTVRISSDASSASHDAP
jgi:hypothetical protein